MDAVHLEHDERATPATHLFSRLSNLWYDVRAELGSEDPPEPDGGKEPPAEGTEPPPAADPVEQPPEPFLVVNDRTSYDTMEDAKKGAQEAGKTIEEYSRHGTPQEIAAMRDRLGMMERIAGGNTPKQPGESETAWQKRLSKMSPDHQAQWANFDESAPHYLKSKGYVTKQELDAMLDERIDSRAMGLMSTDRKVTSAREHFSNLAKERGIPLTLTGMKVMEEVIADAAEQQGSELLPLWEGGEIEEFARRAFIQVFGEKSSRSPSSQPSPNGDPRRGPDGKFVSPQDYDETKQRARNLPSAPPKGSAAPTKGGQEEPLEDRINPKKRVVAAKEFAKEMLGF